jgi:hypothetical protein
MVAMFLWFVAWRVLARLPRDQTAVVTQPETPALAA